MGRRRRSPLQNTLTSGRAGDSSARLSNPNMVDNLENNDIQPIADQDYQDYQDLLFVKCDNLAFVPLCGSRVRGTYRVRLSEPTRVRQRGRPRQDYQDLLFLVSDNLPFE